MLTVEGLRAWGANVDEGLGRCLKNETFYLTLVKKAIQDPAFEKLNNACGAGDLDQGFDAAHALKGMMANLALTPILNPVVKITELLRARTATDYGPLLAEINSARDQVLALAE